MTDDEILVGRNIKIHKIALSEIKFHKNGILFYISQILILKHSFTFHVYNFFNLFILILLVAEFQLFIFENSTKKYSSKPRKNANCFLKHIDGKNACCRTCKKRSSLVYRIQIKAVDKCLCLELLTLRIIHCTDLFSFISHTEFSRNINLEQRK